VFDDYAQVELSGSDAERALQEISTRASRLGGISDTVREEEIGLELHGQRIFYWTFVINTLKREGRYADALNLALECLELADRSLHTADGAPLLWWHVQVVKIAMKVAQYDVAIDALEKWLSSPGVDAHPEEAAEALKRLDTARKAKARADGLREKVRPIPMWD
jgi:tetratricopeptide (TPR) repeat protein